MHISSYKSSVQVNKDLPDSNEFKRENSLIGENEQDFSENIKDCDSKELSLSYQNGERKGDA